MKRFILVQFWDRLAQTIGVCKFSFCF